MAFALYFILPAKKIDDKSPEIRALAQALGRTPNAVALKAWNIAAHDEQRLASGKVGMQHSSKLDSLVWEEHAKHGDEFVLQAVSLLKKTLKEAAYGEDHDAVLFDVVDLDVPEGKEREAVVAQRINQSYFRNTLLANYGGRCCMTGLTIEPLLVASHIKPWAAADPKTERLAASNGLLLNALHDRAFDRGLITIDEKYRIIVSPRIKRTRPDGWEILGDYEGKEILLPSCNPPSAEFIEYHNDVIFQSA
jgi:putative restriction endonuclease